MKAFWKNIKPSMMIDMNKYSKSTSSITTEVIKLFFPFDNLSPLWAKFFFFVVFQDIT